MRRLPYSTTARHLTVVPTCSSMIFASQFMSAQTASPLWSSRLCRSTSSSRVLLVLLRPSNAESWSPTPRLPAFLGATSSAGREFVLVRWIQPPEFESRPRVRNGDRDLLFGDQAVRSSPRVSLHRPEASLPPPLPEALSVPRALGSGPRSSPPRPPF